MLGNLILANSVDDGNGVFLDPLCTNDSFKLCFGSNEGPSIYGFADGSIKHECDGEWEVLSNERAVISSNNLITFEAQHSITLDAPIYNLIAPSGLIITDQLDVNGNATNACTLDLNASISDTVTGLSIGFGGMPE